MVRRLLGTKPLFKPMLVSCQLILRNKFQWSVNQNAVIFTRKHVFDVVCEMTVILIRFQCLLSIDTIHVTDLQHRWPVARSPQGTTREHLSVVGLFTTNAIPQNKYSNSSLVKIMACRLLARIRHLILIMGSPIYMRLSWEVCGAGFWTTCWLVHYENYHSRQATCSQWVLFLYVFANDVTDTLLNQWIRHKSNEVVLSVLDDFFCVSLCFDVSYPSFPINLSLF